jgi:hypothetical protein
MTIQDKIIEKINVGLRYGRAPTGIYLGHVEAREIEHDSWLHKPPTNAPAGRQTFRGIEVFEVNAMEHIAVSFDL